MAQLNWAAGFSSVRASLRATPRGAAIAAGAADATAEPADPNPAVDADAAGGEHHPKGVAATDGGGGEHRRGRQAQGATDAGAGEAASEAA